MPAEVGSVYIRVHALTDKFGADLQKAFSGVNTAGAAKSGNSIAKSFSNAVSKGIDKNIFTRVGDSLGDFGGAAGSAREKLFELTRTGNITGTAMTLLLGSLSALIGGLGGLIGAVGGAVPAIMGLVGAFINLKLGMAVGELAFKGIDSAVQKATTSSAFYGKTAAQVARAVRDLAFAHEEAELGVKRATLNLEKARASLIRTQDMPANSMARKEALLAYQEAELNLRKAKEKNKDAAAEAANPAGFNAGDSFAGLTPSQKDFAKFLVEIQKDMKQLQEIAAKGFLPTLKKNIQEIVDKVFPTLKIGIGQIAAGLAGLTTNLKNAIVDPKNVEKLGAILKNVGENLPIVGEILGNVYTIILDIVKASNPLVKKFLGFLQVKTGDLAEWLNTKEASKELEGFFNRSGEIMGQLYNIIANTFGAIGGIINANFDKDSGGGRMLTWLEETTKKWSDFTNNVSGDNEVRQYFIDTAENAKIILDAVGGLVVQFLKLGADPNIGKTFQALQEGAPAMERLGEKLAAVGPSFGKLVSDIVEFIDNITDTKSIQLFFDIISGAISGINDLFKNEGFKKFMDNLGIIHGLLFGLVAVNKGVAFGFEYVGETVDSFKDNFEKVTDLYKSGKQGLSDIKGAVENISKVDLSGLKGAFDLGKQSGGFANGLKAMQSELGTKLGVMKAQVSQSFAQMTYSSNGFVSGLGKIGGFFVANPWVAAILLIVGAMVALYNSSEEFRKFVDGAFKRVMDLFKQTWDDIVKAFQPLTDAFDELLNTLGIKTAGAAGSPLVVFFEALINVIEGILQVLGPVITFIVTQVVNGFKAWITILSGVIKIIKGVIDIVVAFFKALFTGKWDAFAKAAEKAFGDIKKGASQIFAGIVNYFIDGINNAIKLANSLTGKIKTATNGVISIGQIPLMPKYVPQLAKGGTVMPSAGGSLVNVAEAGRPERIEPLDSNGLSNRDKALIDALTRNRPSGQGIQIIVNPAPGMNENDLAEIVSRKLAFQLARGGY
jgi:hypothetical protein